MSAQAKSANAIIGAAVIAAALVATTIEADACACCTNLGQRRVVVEKLDQQKLAQIEMIRFDKTAFLFVGEGDAGNVKGIVSPSLRYDLTASHRDGGFVFALRDAKGQSGALTLQRPTTISVFEVDPRDTDEEGGLGPSLYKEWKLTSRASGSGVFAPGAGAGQQITLALQGRGNSCTSSVDFTHWTLIVHGKTAEYHLFGKLEQSR